MKHQLSTQHKPYLNRLLFSRQGTAHRQDLLLATLLISIATIVLMYAMMILALASLEQGWIALEIQGNGPQASGVMYALVFAFGAWIVRLLLHIPIIIKRCHKLGINIYWSWLRVAGILFPLFSFVVYIVILFLSPSQSS